jgi:putrescine aminotransferase
VGETRGLGMMAAVELVQDKAARKRFDRSAKIGETFNKHMVDCGVWSRINGDMYYIAPPLTTTREQIDRIAEAVDKALKATFG